MDYQSAPPPEEVSHGYYSDQAYKIQSATFTCVTALILFVNYFIAVTRFRLWHSNSILEKFIQLVDSSLTWLISYCASQLSTAPYINDLYLIWLVVLTIAYDNVITISSASSPGTTWLLREFATLINTIYVGYFINRNGDDTGYRLPLLILWLILLVKFSLRLVSHKVVNRAYGFNNSKLVADYMKIEHQLSNEEIDPTSMRGYKYLVMGEGKINAMVEGPQYGANVELPEGVVTLEKVWGSNVWLLDPSIDTDNRLKDVCLSFAFFKLLKRQYFDCPTTEDNQVKTKRLVVEGLLSGNNYGRVYRVIEMEIGFLRDLFYTRYPLSFAIGFPIFLVILLTGMFGVSVWISIKAFLRHDDPQADYLRSKHNQHNIDYTITNILLIMITVMEALETLFYILSDWTKVVLICQIITNRMLHRKSYYKVLAHLCKWKLSRSLNNTIGQFSLLKNYYRYSDRAPVVNNFPYSKWGWSPGKVAPRGMKEDRAVVLSPDVKRDILSSLGLLNGIRPTKAVASLERNGVKPDLEWTCALETEFHTLIVWHIATSLCDINPVNYGGTIKSIEPHHSVANHLSKYCAYLMVFLPDMLPESNFSLKLFFRAILLETKEFFGEERNTAEMYQFMLNEEYSGNKVIHKAMKLGRQLTQISNDARRWKIIADFWSEFIIFLAPSGKVGEHLRLLESGGEFITHLWALLYHTGIVGPSATVSSETSYP